MNALNPLHAVKGIGEKREKCFNEKGIFTLLDLLFFFPRAFKDYSKEITILESLENIGLCPVAVETKPTIAYFGRRRNLVRCKVSDGETQAILQFFNMPFMVRNMEKGDTVYLYGQAKKKDDKIIFSNPGFEKKTDWLGKYPFVPGYPEVPGVSGRMIMKTVATVLEALKNEPDYTSDEFLQAFGLPSLSNARQALHFPQTMEENRAALKRFSIEELLVFLCLLTEQIGIRRKSAVKLEVSEAQKATFFEALAFAPTSAQARVTQEITQDFASGVMTNRLIQGDVGCGKTAVAFYAMYINLINGYQSVMMAPTEVLARQHYAKAVELFAGLGGRCALITGSDTTAMRREKLAQIAKGEVDLVFGTHALIYGDIAYKRLNLAITDEQHRFGVSQRAKLSFDGNLNMLVMSATPIPRTLALVLYSGMDVSVIDEMPVGRKPVETHIVRENKRKDMYGFVKDIVKKGEQAYVVCPLIDGDSDMRSVEDTAVELTEVFGLSKVAVMHGRLSADEKQALMQDFSNKKIEVLVATTVIEVGVDVPNAVVMVVENAERFGLSTLHQLRGRVGRGQQQAYCFLVSEHRNDRLEILKNETDGLKIAEKDLQLRGPGQFLGVNQHGITDFYMNKLVQDMSTLKLAQDIFARMRAGEFADEYHMARRMAEKKYEKLLKDIALN
ncbi:MAG: ATP-dependent DNA helicase RecG [Eubacteriales bacterium]